MKYVAPRFGEKAFTCPHCGVLAAQKHYWSIANLEGSSREPTRNVIRTMICTNCEKYCIWHLEDMLYPNRGNAPLPNPDMPEDVKKDYEEAAAIASLSPKGAAALLRLAIQKLCIELGGKGESINADIKKLVEGGLSVKIQKALDVVRVIGNNAVHPGQIDVDDLKTVGKLFTLINLIVAHMVSMPKDVDNMYSSLPDCAKNAIDKRNGRTE